MRAAHAPTLALITSCPRAGASPDGRWALLFSTQLAAPQAQEERQAPLLQPVIDATYALFFRVAPQLAGAQQDGGKSGGGSNEQRLSLSSGVVENRVRVPLPGPLGGGALEIFVDGEVDAPDAADDLRVAFTECSFRLRPRGGGGGSAREGALRVPLPRPVGSLRTTHCDEELRVSRGGRGGVFVLRRLKSE